MFTRLNVTLPAAFRVSDAAAGPVRTIASVIVILPVCVPESPAPIVTETPAFSIVVTEAAETFASSVVGVKVPPMKEPPLVADELIVTFLAASVGLGMRQKRTNANSNRLKPA
jgi:hypothetical protein